MGIKTVVKQAQHRSTNMLRHMSDIMFDFFEDLPTYLQTYRPTFPVLFASLLRRSLTNVQKQCFL